MKILKKPKLGSKTAGFIPQVLAGFGLVSDYLGKKSAKKAQQSQAAWLQNILPMFKQEAAPFLAAQLGSLQSAKGEIKKGYGKAGKAVTQLGQQSRRTAKEAGQQVLGAGKSSLVGSGLFDSTKRLALERGVASDTARIMGGIDEQIAALQVELATGEATALAGAEQNIASAQGGYIANLLNALNSAAGAQASIQHTSSSTLPGIMQLIESFKLGA